MIPQRNISLLSNRLAMKGERRLREDVLERDYCLAWLLAGIAESGLKAVLAFIACGNRQRKDNCPCGQGPQ